MKKYSIVLVMIIAFLSACKNDDDTSSDVNCTMLRDRIETLADDFSAELDEEKCNEVKTLAQQYVDAKCENFEAIEELFIGDCSELSCVVNAELIETLITDYTTNPSQESCEAVREAINSYIENQCPNFGVFADTLEQFDCSVF